MKSSPPSDLHPFNQPVSADETPKTNDAIGKLNGKISFKVKEESS